jgi:hypothetical protein
MALSNGERQRRWRVGWRRRLLAVADQGRMIGSEHLTEENVSHISTRPGQAHFALPGAVNTCRECLHWLSKGERTSIGLLKDAICWKARQSIRRPIPVPHTAQACKHFAANPTPPAI